IDGRGHRRGAVDDRAAKEGGLRETALTEPEVSFAAEQAIAQQQTHRLDQKLWLPVVLVVLDQHVLDGRRICPEVTGIPWQRRDTDIVAVSSPKFGEEI